MTDTPLPRLAGRLRAADRHIEANFVDDGARAHDAGLGVDDCPYRTGPRRWLWLRGWGEAYAFDQHDTATLLNQETMQ